MKTSETLPAYLNKYVLVISVAPSDKSLLKVILDVTSSYSVHTSGFTSVAVWGLGSDDSSSSIASFAVIEGVLLFGDVPGRWR